MNPVRDDRIPATIGGLIDLAFAALAERWFLYLILALAAFAFDAIAEFALPAHTVLEQGVREGIVDFTSLFVDAFIVASVALALGSRLSGTTFAPRTIIAAATLRWLPALGAMVIAQFVTVETFKASGLAGLNDPLLLIAAPLTWLLWAGLSLAGPCATLSADRPSLAIVTGFLRALVISLRVTNLRRLAVLAAFTMPPLLLETVLYDVFTRRGIPRASFWASMPLDALLTPPLAAVQTAFALDMARRVAQPVRR